MVNAWRSDHSQQFNNFIETNLSHDSNSVLGKKVKKSLVCICKINGIKCHARHIGFTIFQIENLNESVLRGCRR